MLIRKKKVPPALDLKLDEGGILQAQQINPPQIQDDYKFNQKDQIDDNKKFLSHILKFKDMAIKLPEYITNKTIQESLKALNVRLASIASSKEILANYETYFGALNVFFERLIGQEKKLPADEQVIWRMFFLNNIAIIAFNNGDYTTSLQIFRKIMIQYNKKQFKQPVFSLAITNLSAIYYKMDSKVKCFEYLQSAYQYSKKLVDSVTSPIDDANQKQINCVLAIQCIMMVKNKRSVETSTHNVKQIEKLIIKLIKQGNKVQSSMNIPYINKYLQQKKFTELKQIQSRTGSQASSRRSRLRNYRLDSISIDHNVNAQISRSIFNLQTQFDSPVKRYSYNKIKQQIDELNNKVTRLELKTNKIQTNITEVLNILKLKKIQDEQKIVFKQTSIISNIQSNTEVINTMPKYIFKTLQIFITFYDQGLKLKSFTGEQEKLSWGELQNIFKLLDLIHVYFKYVELIPTRHTIAWIISKYVTIENGIKIKKQPNPIINFQYMSEKYGLYHIKQRQFTIYGPNIQPIILQMSEKAFNYYFEILKIDEFQNQCMTYFSTEPQKSKSAYFLQIIQAKAGETFSEDILQTFENLIKILKQTQNNPYSFKKVKLWFDETTESCCFIGAYYQLFKNNEQQQVQIKIYPLNNYQSIEITNPIIQNFTFNNLQTQYSFTLAQSSRLHLQNIYMNLVQLVSIRIQTVKRNGKIQNIIHAINSFPQYVYFEQRMILKKYYRPVSISIIRTNNKFLNLNFSYFNEVQLLKSNISVVLNAGINKKTLQNIEELQNKFAKIKQKVKTEFLAKQFGHLESGVLNKNFIHIQQFINMIETETKNWGQ